MGLPGKSDRIPKFIDGVQIYGDKASYSDMLQYKAIIMLEGNGKSNECKYTPCRFLLMKLCRCFIRIEVGVI